MSKIFIPKKLKVGFQNRNGTYTGKLAYVIYYDNTGKLRKETSWEGWRDKNIEPLEIDNEPTSGFVLNKKAGGYMTGWDMRQTYVRVYDPRDFEFEIDVPNLLYILENTSSIKGKGLEGEFVYGWDGKDLVLIPTDAPEYQEYMNRADKVYNQKALGAKDMKIGYTYYTADNVPYVYLGRYMEYDYLCSRYYKSSSIWCPQEYWTYDIDETWQKDIYDESEIERTRHKAKERKKKHWFYCPEASYDYICNYVSIPSNKFYSVSESPDPNFSEYFNQLEHNPTYNPIDFGATAKRNATYEEFETAFSRLKDIEYNEGISYIQCYGNNVRVHCNIQNQLELPYVYVCKLSNGEYIVLNSCSSKYENAEYKTASIQDLYNHLNPYIYEHYLKNGNVFQTKGLD